MRHLDIMPKKLNARGGGYRKCCVAIVLTISFFMLFWWAAMSVLRPGDEVGITNLKYWGKGENNKTDILFMGSSAVFINIDLSELWKKYGIAGFCNGGCSAAIYDCYYRLIESDEKNHVDKMVMDVKPCAYSMEYNVNNGKVYNILGTDLSFNKIHYIKAATPINESLAYIIEFPIIHSRYNSLNKSSYIQPNLQGNNKGVYRLEHFASQSSVLLSAADYNTYRALDEKEEYYLRKVIEYCKKEEIDLLLIKTPDISREKNQPFYNTVELIATEYSIPFFNMNLYDEEIGLVSSDLLDGAHLNTKGARKCADFLGEYLVSHYDLTDHRGDADYASWDRFAANRENLYLRAITEKDDYFEELVRDEKSVMAVPYRLPESKSEAYLSMQEQLQSVRHFDWDKEDILYGEENAESFIFGDNTVVITKDYGNCRIDLNDGEDVINVTQPGMLLVVYDSINDEIADMVLLERDSGYTLKHLYNP